MPEGVDASAFALSLVACNIALDLAACKVDGGKLFGPNATAPCKIIANVVAGRVVRYDASAHVESGIEFEPNAAADAAVIGYGASFEVERGAFLCIPVAFEGNTSTSIATVTTRNQATAGAVHNGEHDFFIGRLWVIYPNHAPAHCFC